MTIASLFERIVWRNVNQFSWWENYFSNLASDLLRSFEISLQCWVIRTHWLIKMKQFKEVEVPSAAFELFLSMNWDETEMIWRMMKVCLKSHSNSYWFAKMFQLQCKRFLAHFDSILHFVSSSFSLLLPSKLLQFLVVLPSHSLKVKNNPARVNNARARLANAKCYPSYSRHRRRFSGKTTRDNILPFYYSSSCILLFLFFFLFFLYFFTSTIQTFMAKKMLTKKIWFLWLRPASFGLRAVILLLVFALGKRE